MPKGDRSARTERRKRKGGHIEAHYRDEGASRGAAEWRARATVDQQEGGGGRMRGKSASRY